MPNSSKAVMKVATWAAMLTQRLQLHRSRRGLGLGPAEGAQGCQSLEAARLEEACGDVA